MQEKEPWIIVKSLAENPDNQKLIDNLFAYLFATDRQPGYHDQPFPSQYSSKMLHMMKVVDKMLEWENAGKTKLLSVGYSLRAPVVLFRKIEDAEIQAQVDKLKAGLIKPVEAAPAAQGRRR